MPGSDVDPTDKVRLAARSALNNKLTRRTYLAVHFDVLHARHLEWFVCSVPTLLRACGLAGLRALRYSCAIQMFALTLGT